MKRSPKQRVTHRELETDEENPAGQIVEIVAELKNTEIEELENAWQALGDLLDSLFTNPPSPEAQAQICFSYEGYRITVEQSGHATFVQSS